MSKRQVEWLILLMLLDAVTLASSLTAAGEPSVRHVIERSWTAENGLPPGPLRGPDVDGDGYVWLAGGEPDQAWRFDGLTFDPRRPPEELDLSCIPSSAGSCAVEAAGWGTWTLSADDDASFQLGLRRPSSILLWNLESGLVDEMITSLMISSSVSDVFFTARQRGLFRLSPESMGQPTAVPTPSTELWAVAELRDGRLAVGSADRGVFIGPRADLPNPTVDMWQSLHPGDDAPLVFRLLSASDGSLWIGSFQGLERYQDGELVKWGPESGMPPGSVRGLYEDRRGRIWIAMAHGAVRYDPTTEPHFKLWTRADGLPVSKTATFWDDGNGVWVATGGDLARIDEMDRVTSPGSPGLGPPATDVTAMVAGDDGNLWLGSSGRVGRVPMQDLRARLSGSLDGFWRPEIWDRRHGVPPGALDGMERDAQGRIWVAIRGGLMRVEAPAPRPGPPISLAALRLDGRSLALPEPGEPGSASGPPLVIPPRPRDLEWVLTIPRAELDAPSRLHYRLIGAERLYFGEIAARRPIVLAGLGPGSYVLEAQASNRRGELDGPTWRMPFEVEAGFGQTLGSRALILIVGAVLIWGAHRLRLRRLVWQEQALDLEVQAVVERLTVLRGILPICSRCKKIRDDQGLWNRLENYLDTHSEARIEAQSCPECRLKSTGDRA